MVPLPVHCPLTGDKLVVYWMEVIMSDDRRVQLKLSVFSRVELAADMIGVSPAALVAVAVDEYLRSRPDLMGGSTTTPNTVSPTPAPVEKTDQEIADEWEVAQVKPAPVNKDLQNIVDEWEDEPEPAPKPAPAPNMQNLMYDYEWGTPEEKLAARAKLEELGYQLDDEEDAPAPAPAPKDKLSSIVDEWGEEDEPDA